MVANLLTRSGLLNAKTLVGFTLSVALIGQAAESAFAQSPDVVILKEPGAGLFGTKRNGGIPTFLFNAAKASEIEWSTAPQSTATYSFSTSGFSTRR